MDRKMEELKTDPLMESDRAMVEMALDMLQEVFKGGLFMVGFTEFNEKYTDGGTKKETAVNIHILQREIDEVRKVEAIGIAVTEALPVLLDRAQEVQAEKEGNKIMNLIKSVFAAKPNCTCPACSSAQKRKDN